MIHTIKPPRTSNSSVYTLFYTPHNTTLHSSCNLHQLPKKAECIIHPETRTPICKMYKLLYICRNFRIEYSQEHILPAMGSNPEYMPCKSSLPQFRRME